MILIEICSGYIVMKYLTLILFYTVKCEYKNSCLCNWKNN